MAHADQPAANLPGAPPVTVAALFVHARKYGLDNSNTGYRGAEERYKGYSTLRTDSLVHVARTFLTEAAYLQLLEGIGYSGYAEAASADWRALHEQD